MRSFIGARGPRRSRTQTRTARGGPRRRVATLGFAVHALPHDTGTRATLTSRAIA
jgi:hypothetical protein